MILKKYKFEIQNTKWDTKSEKLQTPKGVL